MPEVQDQGAHMLKFFQVAESQPYLYIFTGYKQNQLRDYPWTFSTISVPSEADLRVTSNTATELQLLSPQCMSPVDPIDQPFLASLSSNTSNHSPVNTLNRQVKQETHCQHTLQKSRKETETKGQNIHPTKTNLEIIT